MEHSSSNLIKADELNWELLKHLFGNSKKFKLIKPQKQNSYFDGILSTQKNNKNLVILVEVKCREISSNTLINEFKGTFFLEKKKYVNLHKNAQELSKVPGREIKIWYINKTTDGIVYVHDITNKDYSWINADMNSTTYCDNKKIITKKVALLHISDCISTFILNIK